MSFARGLLVQLEVIHALVLRETRTRFGTHQLGYVWALLEPVLMILTFYVMFRIAHHGSPPGMDAFSFLATGILPYSMFSSATGRVAEAINGNKALLFYPHVRPLDLVFARGVLEIATYAAVFLVLIGGHIVYVQSFAISSALDTTIGFALAGLLGTALGLVFCGLGQLSPTVDRMRGPLLRPLFWLSGIFFTADALPEHVRPILLWNPVLHTTELVRAGWFPEYEVHHGDPSYVMIWILGLSLTGLLLERVVRRRIEVT